MSPQYFTSEVQIENSCSTISAVSLEVWTYQTMIDNEVFNGVLGYFITVAFWSVLISNNQTDVTSFSEDGRGVKWLCNDPKPYHYSNQNNKINPKRIKFRN